MPKKSKFKDKPVDMSKGALPSKGVDIPTERKIELALEAMSLYVTGQYTLASCLKHAGIGVDTTFYGWCKKIPQIQELYEEAKIERRERRKDRLVMLALTNLEKAVCGHRVVLTEEIQYKDKESKRFKTTQRIKKEKYIPPSVRAIETVLYNYLQQEFVRSPTADTANEGAINSITIEIEGSVLPVTSEDDIQNIHPNRKEI